MRQVSARIAEHAAAHHLDSVEVVLHGGEPLLAGAARIAECATTLRAAAGPGVEVCLRLQTNGTLLDSTTIEVLAEHRIMVGVSLDGGPADHDRYRRRPNGSGSHELVARALTELTGGPHRDIYGGLLCTVDLASDPVATYEALLRFDPPAVDFLLPHGNWSAPPPGRTADRSDTPYAAWLIAAFDRWYLAPRLETSVRTFEQVLALLLGGESTMEGLGTSPASIAVVETDGAIEQSDMLTTAFHGAAVTGLHVSVDPFDAALRLPDMVARQSGLAALSATCQACRFRYVCGGGFYGHRYRAGSGFANPSVYCDDLYGLIEHCRHRLVHDLDQLRT